MQSNPRTGPDDCNVLYPRPQPNGSELTVVSEGGQQTTARWSQSISSLVGQFIIDAAIFPAFNDAGMSPYPSTMIYC